MNPNNFDSPVSRRSFLKASSLVAASGAAAPYLSNLRAAAEDPIRVGLVGCGGRGKGAAEDAVKAAGNVQVVAVADVFADRAQAAATQFKVNPDRCFSGFDAYRKVLGLADVNYVILATPPGFRPLHFPAAIEAGKHVFMEKPVAVDGPGSRAMLKAGELAAQKKLCVVAGTQRRHQKSYLETVQRIHDGAIGEILCLRAYWNQNAIWNNPWKPGVSDMENHLRNWYHYIWLSGDHIVEQHLHNIDVCNWVMKAHPTKAYGRGARQVLTGRGQIYDHFTVEFEYPNGVRMFSQCRQINNTSGNVSEAVVGAHGTANPNSTIMPKGFPIWRFRGANPNPYVQEHADMIAAIRAGKPINETQEVVESTLTAIMGRESAYTGQMIDWDSTLNSTLNRMPDKFEFGPMPPVTVPVPGEYEFV